MERKKRYQPFKTKILTAVIIANLAILAAVAALPRLLPEPEGARAFREAMASLERSVDKEETVTGVMIEVSRLARKRGGGPAVKEVIRDHDSNMASLRKSADVLKGAANPFESRLLVFAVAGLIAMQAYCLFACLLMTAGKAEDQAETMSRRIDRMLAVNKPDPAKVLNGRARPEVRINGMLIN